MAVLLQLNEIVRDRVQLRQNGAATLNGFQHVVANCLHLAMFKSPGEDAPLSFHRPFADCFIYQEVEESVVCRGDGASKAGLLWVCRFLVCEIVCLFEQVIWKWHRLRPRLFLQYTLFGHATKIVVGKEAH
ncbi:MAG TPA: hypothetical protein VGE89_15445 [Bryobacteraceae bacterium]|jgi:hypothetical protein